MPGATALSQRLHGLQGPERDAFVRDFRAKNGDKIFVAIDLHNHQPIYRPGTHPADTPEIQNFVLGSGDADNRREVYTQADAYAVEQMQGRSDLPSFGIQVSYSGSLAENLEKTAERGLWPGAGWNRRYHDLRQNAFTPLGNPRLDLVNIGYHHPLMGLIATGNAAEDKDIELQLKMHQATVERLFGGPISKGFFPPEMAFAERMIPASKRAGVEWTMVDNLHIDRANTDYDNRGDGLAHPNGADRVNPGPHPYETLPNDLAKTHKVSPGALRPHYARFVDPATGSEERMVVVPEERSLSSYIQKDRDGSKLSEIINKFGQYNTDPNHPLLVLLACDGDNNGSNSGEFHRNVPVDLATRYPGKVILTTVQDYLDIFPPAEKDVVHVEDGAWWGANLGDPQFSKWLDDPGATWYSAKKNSWAVLTAARNAVSTADAMEPAGADKVSVQHIIDGSGTDVEKAWHGLLVGQTSCYEYWNPDNVLSYSSVKGANQAVNAARQVIARHAASDDKVGPSVFLPMNAPYNPTPSAFQVITYAYDTSGVADVKVKWRVLEGMPTNPVDFTYAGRPWDHEVLMTRAPLPDLANKPDVWVEPKARADEYRANVTAGAGMVQYYVEATDALGNVTRSPIRTVEANAAGR